MVRLIVLSFVILFIILYISKAVCNDLYSVREAMEYQNHKRRFDICRLPVEPGKCRHGVKSWYFNHKTRKCVKFIYSLCGGNENRFYKKSECEGFCKG